MRIRERTLIGAMLAAMLLCWPTAFGQEAEPPPVAETEEAAAGAGTGTIRVAKVNLTRIELEFGELRERQGDLQAWADERGGFIPRLTGFLFLSDENFQEAAAILQRAAPDEQARKRLEELRQVSEDKEKRWLDLRANTQRTPEEDDEFNTLRETYEARQRKLEELNRQFQEELRQKRLGEIGKLMGKVEEAITAEAEAQKFDYVFDAEVVFVGAVDITEEVLKRLNAGQEGGGEQDEGGDEGGGEPANQ
jgi:Skp family chaperone for outer membrane proteins